MIYSFVIPLPTKSNLILPLVEEPSAVIKFAALHLCPGGRLYFELNPNTADAVISLLKTMDFVDIVVENDMQNQARMLVSKTRK